MEIVEVVGTSFHDVELIQFGIHHFRRHGNGVWFSKKPKADNPHKYTLGTVRKEVADELESEFREYMKECSAESVFDYCRRNLGGGVFDFAGRATVNHDGKLQLTIHPDGVNGETQDFTFHVREVELTPEEMEDS